MMRTPVCWPCPCPEWRGVIGVTAFIQPKTQLSVAQHTVHLQVWDTKQ